MYRLTFNLVILILSFYVKVVYFINKLGWRQYVGFVVFGEINYKFSNFSEIQFELYFD